MAKGNNDGSIEMGSRKPVPLAAIWVSRRAQQLGLTMIRKANHRGFINPLTNAEQSFQGIWREDWERIEEHCAQKSIDGVTDRVCEIDGENLSPAEQRRFRAKLQANTDRVSAALREVKAQVFIGITEPLVKAPTAELLALQRAVNELVASATQVA